MENQKIYKNPEKYGLQGWRKARKRGNVPLWFVAWSLLAVGAWAGAIYVIAHFVIKYW